ncbi:efflux RND transporter periplasmic adaptor subunit [Methylomarinum sp. Ch1-1]|uniref:Efflux RND transporter periplasmic adaptor subunit n=1 Tax=Methylomarinum roseum TaxID=3067653 RepID=A0AAU7NRA1_9GAMM|nr:efflux RND transporter periplasmic adaptor subunit [Methylomarinum sp. Ch1-1]MDP4520561.1 efflux RND transporter periplasmic adaptor subunit [Methylomarinum sp. Ch1-1]
MNSQLKKGLMALAAAALLILMILWMAGAFNDKIVPDTLPAGLAYQGPVLKLKKQPVPIYEEIAATLQSEQSSAISAQIMARVTKVHVHAGDSVNDGDLLIELDNVDLKSRVAQARDQRNALYAQLQRAKQHYERTRHLFAKQSATQATLEVATAEYHSVRAQYSAAKQRMAEVENALSYSRIKATFSGRVIDHFVENGDMATPGMRLLSVYDPHTLRVAAYVRESLALTLQTGLRLQAVIDALQKEMTVVIDEIVPAAEPGARSFLVKAQIEHDVKLLPGMFARIRIPLGMEDRLLIPARYSKQVGQLDVVWVVKQGVVERRFVRLGRQSNGLVRVISGLREGEQLLAPEDLPDSAV